MEIKNIKLREGEEAAQRAALRDRGFNDDQIGEVARITRDNQRLEQEERDRRQRAQQEERARREAERRERREQAELERFREQRQQSRDRIRGLRGRIDEVRQDRDRPIGGFSGLEELSQRIANAASQSGPDNFERRIADLNEQILAEERDQASAARKLAKDNDSIKMYLKMIAENGGGLG